MKNLARLAFVCFTSLALIGCASQKDSAPSTTLLNARCVVSGEPVDASSPTVDYNGGKLAFCCDKCIAKWNAMDDAGKQGAFAAKK